MWTNRLSLCCYYNFNLLHSNLYRSAISSIYHNKNDTRNGTLFINSSPVKEYKFFYSVQSASDGNENSPQKETIKKKPKKEITVYITLLGVDNNISITTLQEANKLAKKRNLKLVKVTDFDPKSSRAVYQLVTEAQFLKEDKEWIDSKSKSEKFIKGDKFISFSSNISEHDLTTKAKMMKKWLAKRFEVRVVINGDMKSGENIYKIVEREIGAEGRIVQKRVKGSDVRFQIIPPKTSEVKSTQESEVENT